MVSLTRWSDVPTRTLFRRELGRLFDDLLPELEVTENDGVWAPRMDLSETDKAYEIHLDLPGVSKDQIKVDFQDGCLSISGERKHEEKKEGKDFRRMERSFGSFYRSLTLPTAVLEDKIKATFKDGVLTIGVPKAPEVTPIHIPVA
ncbi:MAG: Hsp20/alpha crystallin family protein [Gemmatimonadota bacterium]